MGYGRQRPELTQAVLSEDDASTSIDHVIDVKLPDRLAWSEVIQIDPEARGRPPADTRQAKRQKCCIK